MSHNQNPRPCRPLTSVVRRMNPALPRVLFNHRFLLLRKRRRRVETVNLCIFNSRLSIHIPWNLPHLTHMESTTLYLPLYSNIFLFSTLLTTLARILLCYRTPSIANRNETSACAESTRSRIK